MEDENIIMGLKTIVNQHISFLWELKKSSLRISSLYYFIWMWGLGLYHLQGVMKEDWIDPKAIYNLQSPYPVLLIEASHSPIESMAMTKYLC